MGKRDDGAACDAEGTGRQQSEAYGRAPPGDSRENHDRCVKRDEHTGVRWVCKCHLQHDRNGTDLFV